MSDKKTRVTGSDVLAKADAGDFKEARKLAVELHNQNPSDWRGHIMLAEVALRTERYDVAQTEVRRALTKGVDPVRAARKMREIAKGDANIPLEIEATKQIIQHQPENASEYGQLAHLLATSGETIEAIDALKICLKLKGPMAPVQRTLIELTKCNDADSLKGHLETLVADLPDSWIVQLAAKRFKLARLLAPSRVEVDLCDQLFNLRKPDYRPIDAAQVGKEMTVAGHDRPNGTVIIFSGLLDGHFLPPHLLDHVFAELGLKAIFLTDPKRLIFLDGVPYLAPNLKATQNAIRGGLMMKDKPLYTVGQSSGGQTAIIYGTQMNAHASIVFSAGTTFDMDIYAAFNDKRALSMMRRLNRKLDAKAFSMANMFSKADPDYRVTAYACKNSREDVQHLSLLTPYKQVEATVLDVPQGHNSMLAATHKIGLLKIFKDAFDIA